MKKQGIDVDSVRFADSENGIIPYSWDTVTSVAVLISIFSAPPFEETFRVNMENQPSLLLNPFISQKLISLILSENRLGYTDANPLKENWSISKVSFIALLDEYINPSTDNPKYIDSLNITKENMEEVYKLRESLTQNTEDEVVISPQYPILKLLDRYEKDIKDPDSYVLLFELDNNSNLVIREASSISKSSSLPIGCMRVREMKPQDIMSGLVDELQFYITEEQIMEMVKELSLNLEDNLVFLGEILKVPGVKDSILPLVTNTFFNRNGKVQTPSQMVYFTMPGSPVAKYGLSPIGNIILKKLKSNVRYGEETLEMKGKDGKPIIIRSLKVRSND